MVIEDADFYSKLQLLFCEDQQGFSQAKMEKSVLRRGLSG
jgi:hypothetical protein